MISNVELHFLAKQSFSMVPQEKEEDALRIMQKYPDGIIIKSELDNDGARSSIKLTKKSCQ